MTIFLISPSKIMDSHKLKLVDFDSPEKKTEDSARLYQEQSSKSRTQESTNKAQVDGKVRSDGHRAPQHGANVTSTTTTPSASVKRFCLIKCRSDSASFSTTPNSKKHTINNTSSSEDLKNVTKESSNYKKRFNLIFKKDSILNLHLKGGDYKRNKKHNKEIENQRYESKQETHNVTVSSKKSSKTQQMENNKKLPNDIFGFQKSNRSVDSCLYETSCNFLNVDANSAFKKLRKGFSKQHSNLKQQTPPLMESADKHHKVKVLNTDINSMQEKKVGNHNHSDDHVLSYKIRLSHEEVNKDTQRTNLNDNLTKDAKVLVSASSLAPIIKSCIDVACANNKSGVAPKKLRRRIIKHSDMQKSSSRSDVNESCFVKCKPYLVARANVTVKNETVINDTVVNVDEAKKRTIKSYVKRVCLGFIIIVWSPCLLVVIILAWILRKMKFLGEKNMKRISSMDSVNQKSLVDEREQKKGVQSLIQRFYDHVTGTATAVLSIFKLKRNKKQNNPKGDANNRGCLLDPHRDVYQTMNVLFKRDTQSSQDPNHQCAADDIFKIDQDKEIHKSAKKTSKKNLGFKPEDPLVYTCHYAERPKVNITLQQHHPRNGTKYKSNDFSSYMHHISNKFKASNSNKNQFKSDNFIPQYCIGQINSETTDKPCEIQPNDTTQTKSLDKNSYVNQPTNIGQMYDASKCTLPHSEKSVPNQLTNKINHLPKSKRYSVQNVRTSESSLIKEQCKRTRPSKEQGTSSSFVRIIGRHEYRRSLVCKRSVNSNLTKKHVPKGTVPLYTSNCVKAKSKKIPSLKSQCTNYPSLTKQLKTRKDTKSGSCGISATAISNSNKNDVDKCLMTQLSDKNKLESASGAVKRAYAKDIAIKLALEAKLKIQSVMNLITHTYRSIRTSSHSKEPETSRFRSSIKSQRAEIISTVTDLQQKRLLTKSKLFKTDIQQESSIKPTIHPKLDNMCNTTNQTQSQSLSQEREDKCTSSKANATETTSSDKEVVCPCKSSALIEDKSQCICNTKKQESTKITSTSVHQSKRKYSTQPEQSPYSKSSNKLTSTGSEIKCTCPSKELEISKTKSSSVCGTPPEAIKPYCNKTHQLLLSQHSFKICNIHKGQPPPDTQSVNKSANAEYENKCIGVTKTSETTKTTNSFESETLPKPLEPCSIKIPERSQDLFIAETHAVQPSPYFKIANTFTSTESEIKCTCKTKKKKISDSSDTSSSCTCKKHLGKKHRRHSSDVSVTSVSDTDREYVPPCATCQNKFTCTGSELKCTCEKSKSSICGIAPEVIKPCIKTLQRMSSPEMLSHDSLTRRDLEQTSQEIISNVPSCRRKSGRSILSKTQNPDEPCCKLSSVSFPKPLVRESSSTVFVPSRRKSGRSILSKIQYKGVNTNRNCALYQDTVQHGCNITSDRFYPKQTSLYMRDTKCVCDITGPCTSNEYVCTSPAIIKIRSSSLEKRKKNSPSSKNSKMLQMASSLEEQRQTPVIVMSSKDLQTSASLPKKSKYPSILKKSKSMETSSSLERRRKSPLIIMNSKDIQTSKSLLKQSKTSSILKFSKAIETTSSLERHKKSQSIIENSKAIETSSTFLKKCILQSEAAETYSSLEIQRKSSALLGKISQSLSFQNSKARSRSSGKPWKSKIKEMSLSLKRSKKALESSKNLNKKVTPVPLEGGSKSIDETETSVVQGNSSDTTNKNKKKRNTNHLKTQISHKQSCGRSKSSSSVCGIPFKSIKSYYSEKNRRLSPRVSISYRDSQQLPGSYSKDSLFSYSASIQSLKSCHSRTALESCTKLKQRSRPVLSNQLISKDSGTDDPQSSDKFSSHTPITKDKPISNKTEKCNTLSIIQSECACSKDESETSENGLCYYSHIESEYDESVDDESEISSESRASPPLATYHQSCRRVPSRTSLRSLISYTGTVIVKRKRSSSSEYTSDKLARRYLKTKKERQMHYKQFQLNQQKPKTLHTRSNSREEISSTMSLSKLGEKSSGVSCTTIIKSMSSQIFETSQHIIGNIQRRALITSMCTCSDQKLQKASNKNTLPSQMPIIKNEFGSSERHLTSTSNYSESSKIRHKNNTHKVPSKFSIKQLKLPKKNSKGNQTSKHLLTLTNSFAGKRAFSLKKRQSQRSQQKMSSQKQAISGSRNSKTTLESAPKLRIMHNPFIYYQTGSTFVNKPVKKSSPLLFDCPQLTMSPLPEKRQKCYHKHKPILSNECPLRISSPLPDKCQLGSRKKKSNDCPAISDQRQKCCDNKSLWPTERPLTIKSPLLSEICCCKDKSPLRSGNIESSQFTVCECFSKMQSSPTSKLYRQPDKKKSTRFNVCGCDIKSSTPIDSHRKSGKHRSSLKSQLRYTKNEPILSSEGLRKSGKHRSAAPESIKNNELLVDDQRKQRSVERQLESAHNKLSPFADQQKSVRQRSVEPLPESSKKKSLLPNEEQRTSVRQRSVNSQMESDKNKLISPVEDQRKSERRQQSVEPQLESDKKPLSPIEGQQKFVKEQRSPLSAEPQVRKKSLPIEDPRKFSENRPTVSVTPQPVPAKGESSPVDNRQHGANKKKLKKMQNLSPKPSCICDSKQTPNKIKPVPSVVCWCIDKEKTLLSNKCPVHKCKQAPDKNKSSPAATCPCLDKNQSLLQNKPAVCSYKHGPDMKTSQTVVCTCLDKKQSNKSPLCTCKKRLHIKTSQSVCTCTKSESAPARNKSPRLGKCAQDCAKKKESVLDPRYSYRTQMKINVPQSDACQCNSWVPEHLCQKTISKKRDLSCQHCLGGLGQVHVRQDKIKAHIDKNKNKSKSDAPVSVDKDTCSCYDKKKAPTDKTKVRGDSELCTCCKMMRELIDKNNVLQLDKLADQNKKMTLKPCYCPDSTPLSEQDKIKPRIDPHTYDDKNKLEDMIRMKPGLCPNTNKLDDKNKTSKSDACVDQDKVKSHINTKNCICDIKKKILDDKYKTTKLDAGVGQDKTECVGDQDKTKSSPDARIDKIMCNCYDKKNKCKGKKSDTSEDNTNSKNKSGSSVSESSADTKKNSSSGSSEDKKKKSSSGSSEDTKKKKSSKSSENKKNKKSNESCKDDKKKKSSESSGNKKNKKSNESSKDDKKKKSSESSGNKKNKKSNESCKDDKKKKSSESSGDKKRKKSKEEKQKSDSKEDKKKKKTSSSESTEDKKKSSKSKPVKKKSSTLSWLDKYKKTSVVCQCSDNPHIQKKTRLTQNQPAIKVRPFKDSDAPLLYDRPPVIHKIPRLTRKEQMCLDQTAFKRALDKEKEKLIMKQKMEKARAKALALEQSRIDADRCKIRNECKRKLNKKKDGKVSKGLKRLKKGVEELEAKSWPLKLKRVHSASVQVKPVHNRPRTNVATSPSGASVQFEITRKKPSRKSLFGWSSLRKPHSNKSPRDQKYACHAVHSSGSTKRSGLGFKKRSSPTAMHSRTTKCVCYPVRSTGCLKRSDPLTQSAQSETRSGPFAQSSGTTKCVCYSARSTRSKKCLDPLKQPAQSETCSSPRAQSSGTTKCVCYPVRSSRSIKRSEPAECKTRSGLIAQAARTIKGVCYPVRSTKSKKCAEPLAQPAKFETCSGPNTQAASTIKCVCHPVRSTRSKKRSKAFAQPAEFKTCYGPIAQAASTTKCVYYPVRSTRSKKRSAAFAQPAKCETRSDLIAQAARTIKCVFYPVRSTKSKKCSDPYAQPAEFKTCASPIAQAASITKCVCYPLFKKQTCRAVPLGSCGSKHFPCTGTGAPEPPTKVHECQCPNDGIVELKDDAGQPCPPLPDQSSCVCHAVPCPPKKKKKGSPLQQRCTCPKPISHSQCPPAGICCTCRKSRPRKCDPPEVCCTCRTPKKKKKYYTKGAKQAKCPCQNPGQSGYNNVSGYTKDKGTGNVNVNQNPHERGDFDMALCAGRKKPCRLFLPTCLARASCNEKLQTCPNKRKCINKNCKSKRRRRKCCKRKKKKKKFKCSWTAIKYCWEDICEFEREALYDIPELAVCAGANISHSERCRRACYKVRKVCRAFGRCWKAMFLAIGYFCIFCLASPVMGCLYLFYACCNIIICCKFI